MNNKTNLFTSYLIFFKLLIVSLILTFFYSNSLLANARHALVIGNSDYDFGPLANPENDANGLAETLKSVGFKVTLKTNASQIEMEDAIREFGFKLRKGGVGLFYFAGHGVQLGGQNYLIPIGARISSAKDVKYHAVDIGQVLDEMDEARNGLNIVVLDACRNNPFKAESRAFNTRGLAKIDGPRGSLIAYATAPGSVASDGQGDNSPYAKHLMQAIKTPGLQLEQVFKKVLRGVDKETEQKQVPWVSSSYTGEFYFMDSPSSIPEPPIPEPDILPMPVSDSKPQTDEIPSIDRETSVNDNNDEIINDVVVISSNLSDIIVIPTFYNQSNGRILDKLRRNYSDYDFDVLPSLISQKITSELVNKSKMTIIESGTLKINSLANMVSEAKKQGAKYLVVSEIKGIHIDSKLSSVPYMPVNRKRYTASININTKVIESATKRVLSTQMKNYKSQYSSTLKEGNDGSDEGIVISQLMNDLTNKIALSEVPSVLKSIK
ncbi:MAG: caspase family protein [Gammaproteobacteria bacterium]|nr:caspase family protein [Gammaproteobacteria bacterium]